MKKSIVNVLVLCLVAVLIVCSAVGAVPTINYVEIDGLQYLNGDNVVVEKGETLDIVLKVTAQVNEDDIEIEADILGYEYNDHEEISDSLHTFDLAAGKSDKKELSITIPTKLEKDEYDLRVRVGGRTGTALEYLYRLTVEGSRHSLNVRDIVLVPESNIKAGRTLLASVRVQNLGEKDEEDIAIKMSIPDLDVSASAYIDELEHDDSTESEQLYMKIPPCAKPGVYDLITTIEYDEGYENVVEVIEFEVVEDEYDETCTVTSGTSVQVQNQPASTIEQPTAPKTVISVGTLTQDVQKGEGGVIYPLTISNMGKESLSYTVAIVGAETWATTKVSPTNMAVLESGEAMTFYVYVAASEDAAPGEHVFTLSIKSGEDVLKDIAISANVIEVAGEDAQEASGFGKLKSGFQISLVVLVVLLVILGLIIGVNKLRKDDNDDEDEDEDDGQTYY